jgi:hypothetical protein
LRGGENGEEERQQGGGHQHLPHFTSTTYRSHLPLRSRLLIRSSSFLISSLLEGLS